MFIELNAYNYYVSMNMYGTFKLYKPLDFLKLISFL